MDPSIVGNSALLLALLAAQFDLFSGVFSDGDDDDADLPLPDAAYDPALYSGLNYGTGGNDFLTSLDFGDNQAYLLLGGNDILSGSAAADYVEGGAGDDTLTLFQGDDVVLGGAGDDNIAAGTGDDTVLAGDGDDFVDGSQDNDRIEGGAGDDLLRGGVDDDVVLGGDGDDTLTGYRFDEIGRDNRGIDIVDGGEGNDTLLLHGADTGTGGSGGDIFQLTDSGDADALITVTDYSADDDRIVVFYDDSDAPGGPPPLVTVATPVGSADALITVDGIDLAVITGAAGLSSADITVEAFAP